MRWLLQVLSTLRLWTAFGNLPQRKLKTLTAAGDGDDDGDDDDYDDDGRDDDDDEDDDELKRLFLLVSARGP